MSTRRLILVLTVTAALGSAAAEDQPSPGPSPSPAALVDLRLSVDQAVALAISRGDPVNISRYGITAVEGQIMSARSMALPHLSLQGSFTRQSYGRLFGGSSFGSELSGPSLPSPSATTDFYRADLVLSQAIYLGGRTKASLRAARLGRELALSQLEAVTEDVVFATKSAYYRALMEREFVKVAGISVELSKKHLKDAIDQRAAGVATDFEVLRARVRSRTAETDLVRARNSLQLARSALARALRLPPGAPVVLTDVLDYKPATVDESELYADAVGARASIKVASTLARGGEVSVALARADRRPQVTFDAAAGGGADHDLLDRSNFEDNWSFGLRVTVPLFDGHSSRGRILEEMTRLDQARAQLASAARDVRLDIHQAALALRTARELVDAQKESVAEAARAYELAEIRFGAGQVKQLVVFDAEAELANVRRSYYQAVYEHMVAVARIEHAAGTFTPPPNTEKPGPAPMGPERPEVTEKQR